MKTTNLNILIIVFVFIVNVVAGIVIGVYYNRTSFFAEFYLPEDNNIVIDVITPNNNNIITNNYDQYDTIYFRPIKYFTINVGKDTLKVINSKELSLYKSYLSEFGIYINLQPKKFILVVNWILSFNIIRFLIIGGYIILFLYFLLINKKRLLTHFMNCKIRLLRFLLSKGRLKSNNKETLNKKFIILSIIYLLLYFGFTLTKINTPPLNHNSMEPRRALVSMEMKLSGNYFNLTRAGEEYLNKPAGGHYILIPFVDAKNKPEFKMRLSSFCFLIVTSIVIFIGIRSNYKRNDLSVMTALAFLYNNYMLSIRILRIDYLLALVIVSMFFTTYFYGIRHKYILMFIFLLLLGFIGFYIKGFVAIYFMIVATFSILLINEDLKLILSKTLLFWGFVIIMLGCFALFVSGKVDFIIQQIREIDHYSSYDIGYRLKHFFGFWGYISILLSPLLILLPVVLLRNNIIEFLKDKFLSYTIIILLLGTLPFWISPQFLLHYIIMFFPFLLFIVIYFLLQNEEYTIRQKLFLTASAMVLFLSFLIKESFNVEFLLIINLCIPILTVYLPKKLRLSYIYILFFLSFVLVIVYMNKADNRSERLVEEQSKSDCQRIALLTIDKRIALYDEKTNYQDAVIYYLEYYKNEIIYTSTSTTRSHYDYLLVDANQKGILQRPVDSIVQFSYRFERQNKIISMKKDYLYLIDNKR